MKKESYNGWNICTERPGGLINLISREFQYGKHSWMKVYINKELNTDIDTYQLSIIACEPFVFDMAKHFKLHTHINDDNYHALIDEANDVIRGLLTEMHEYIIAMINELPEI